MNNQMNSESNVQSEASSRTAWQVISEKVRERPVAMSEVEDLLKKYYPSCDVARLPPDRDFEIVNIHNHDVFVNSAKKDDKKYMKPFWDRQKIVEIECWKASHHTEAKAAYDKLFQLLSEMPIRPSELGDFARQYGIPKPITTWIRSYVSFEVASSPTDLNQEFCILKAKRDDIVYWGKARKRRYVNNGYLSTGGDKMNSNSDRALPEKQKPFFCGRLRAKKVGQFGLKKYFVATHVISAVDGRLDDDIPLKQVRQYGNVQEGEFIIGITANSGPFIFFNNSKNYPVQLLSWASFKESDSEPSLEKYLEKNKRGRLNAKTRHAHIIGNKKIHGNIIITDDKIYVKGFSSQGDGAVDYAGIFKFDGDFINAVAVHNQATEINYEGMPFVILVPEQGSPAEKHSVIDCDGWVPFVDEGAGDGGVKEKQLPTAGEAMPAGTSQKDDGTPSGDHTIMPNDVAKDVTEQEIQTSESSKKWLPEELEFLDKFLVAVKECGFDFSDRDIARLHTSVKCGRMIVLGGAPGVGKSSIIEMYARCVGGGDKAYLPIAVSPSWAEPADILGDEDLSGKFKDARCGLARYIREANLSEQLRAICFEEMNLACAEHYFSDLMQVVSKPLDEEVNVPGYDRAGLIVSDLGQTNQPSPLTMPPNIRVFGTCNFDITTHPFSARFYDRCSYVELSSNMRGFPDRKVRIDKEILKGVLGDEGACVWDWKYSESEVVNDVSDGLNRLADLLVTTRLYPSPRVLGQMKAYIVARPPIGEERKMTDVALQLRAFDEALAQYVFSKYTPDLNHEVRNEQAKLMEQVKGCGFEMSSSLLGEIDKRLNGFSVE